MRSDFALGCNTPRHICTTTQCQISLCSCQWGKAAEDVKVLSPLHHPPLFAPYGGDLRCHYSWGPGPLVWDWLAYQVWLAECALSDNVTTTVIIMASKLSSANFCLRQSGAKLVEHTILFPASSVWLLELARAIDRSNGKLGNWKLSMLGVSSCL